MRLRSFCAPAIFSPDVTPPHKIVHIFPFGPADWARVCFDLQLALLRKNCLLKDLDNVLPEPVVTMRRVAGLSHDAVMLSGEES